jgi:hypothetical protein
MVYYCLKNLYWAVMDYDGMTDAIFLWRVAQLVTYLTSVLSNPG